MFLPFGALAGSEVARIRVRGSTKISAHIAVTDDGVVLLGRVTDDANRVPGEVHLFANVAEDTESHFGPALRECDETVSREAKDPVGIELNDRGEFCVVFAPPTPERAIHLFTTRTEFWDATEVDVPIRARQNAEPKIPLSGRGRWGWEILELLIGVAIGGWFFASRWKRSPPEGLVVVRPCHGARIDITERHPAECLRWTGRVCDAHDQRPLSDVDVRIEVPTFEGSSIVARTRSNDDGLFELRVDRPVSGAHLHAEADLYGALRKHLPPPSDVNVFLVLRKRAVLDRWIAWNVARGTDKHSSAEPTTQQVRDATDATTTLYDWTVAVERGAFDRVAIDAEEEAAIERKRPDG